MRKLFSLFVALLATTSLLAFKSGALYYNITSSSKPYTVEVTYQEANSYSNYSDLITATIPAGIFEGRRLYSVTSIGDSAFLYCSSLTSITIPNSVTSIGDRAFADCRSLNTIYLEATTPPTLDGSYVFRNTPFFTCYIPSGTLTAYEASDWAQYVGEFVEDSTWQIFYTSADGNIVTPYRSNDFGANVVSNKYRDGQGVITFDAPVTSIGDSAFYDCSSLTSITIPDSVTSIGNSAFSSCSSLTSVTIPNSVTSIGSEAFRGCTSLTSITIPEGVTSIGYYAFRDCSSLTSITLPEGVTSIGDYAFYGCTSLTSITIPNSVTSIGDFAFSDCSSLTSMVVAEGNTVFDSRENCNAIIYTATNDLVAGCQNTIIPNSITSIGHGAFSGCSSLTSITIPNSVTSIGDGAFHYCYRLTSVTIGESVTSIGDEAFYYCSSLTSITIPNSVTSIGYGAFWQCSSLTSITIPNSVTSIEDRAFSNCDSLTSMLVEEGNVTYDSRKNCNAIIETATNTLIAGCQTTIIPNSVTSIGDDAFSGCDGLTSITIPNSVTSIGDWAFFNCDGLTSITIPNSVTSIGWYAFSDCSKLTSITIPNSVTSIGWAAFSNCSSLTSITIPNSVTSIGDYAFLVCSSLDTVTCLAMTPPALGEGVFYGCDNPTLYVPCEALPDYQAHEQWGQFTTIECIASEEAETEEVVIESGTTTVIITWPTEEGADTYTIVIKKDGEVVCTLTFNSEGQLINIAFAPGRDGNHPAQYAEAVANGKGFRFTVTGLEDGTDYTYTVTSKDAANKTISEHSGEFTTNSATALDNTHSQSPITNCQKILRNGQLIILRDGVEYNAMGAQIQ